MKRNFKVMIAIVLMGLILFSAIGCSGQQQGATQGEVSSDNYPSRPIRAIVPFAAGGGSDILVRSLAPYLGQQLGQEVLVENREGAGSQIGLTVVADGEAEGYIIGQANQPATSFTIAFQGANYSVEDFAWMNFHHIDPIAVNVMNDAPWNDFAEFIEDVKQNPGKLSVGVNQMSGPHIYMEYLKDKLDLNVIIVPYDGGGAGRAGLIGGHVDAYFANVFANLPIRDQSRALAVGWDERNELWPEAPTIAEIFDDQELAEFAKPLATARALVVRREFKENYPDRWDQLMAAYEEAFHSEEHMRDAERAGQTPIMYWIGHEEAERLARESHEIVLQYKHLF